MEACTDSVQYRQDGEQDNKNPRHLTALLGDTNSLTTATSRLGVLTTYAETPEVAETAVCPNLLQTLQIVTELRVDGVGEDLAVLAIDNVPLPVQEPCGDLELRRVLDNGDKPLKLVRVELTGTFVQVNIGLLANDVGVATTDTLDFGQGVHDLALAINIGVEETQNVLKLLVGFRDNEGHGGQELDEEI